jgi:predicted anti-sigma-YlaC factor YlaD
MDCHTFESLCQSRFDNWLPLGSLGDLADSAAHVSVCESCRETYSRFALLEASVGAWKQRPSSLLDPDLTERIVQSALDDRPTLTFTARHRRALLATAALLAVSLGLGIGISWTAKRPETPEIASQVGPPPLPEALAEATTATLDLARKTSAPAGRAGSRMIARAKLPSAPQLSLNVPIRPASEMISVLGEDLNRGVKPLSGTARNAFGFLLAPWSREVQNAAPRGGGQGA